MTPIHVLDGLKSIPHPSRLSAYTFIMEVTFPPLPVRIHLLCYGIIAFLLSFADSKQKAMRFWLEKGVAGFRLDALNHMFEVENVTQDEVGVSVSTNPCQNAVNCLFIAAI